MGIKINERLIGDGAPCYVIAEISANHGGDYDRAVELIHKAKEINADCVKIQTYTADTLTLDSDKPYFLIDKGTWKGENLYKLYQQAYTPWEWQESLKNEAEKIGIDFLSTAYDPTSVEFLESINITAYKIASFEFTDIPLIENIASKKKPIIISTGMANLDEMNKVYNILKENDAEFAFLWCKSSYPADPTIMNLRTLTDMKERFSIPIGFSDHSLGSLSAITAVSLGANIIEKHICLDRSFKTADSSFSMDVSEFKKMIEEIRMVEKILGEVSYDLSEKEEYSKKFRRSIFAVKNIQKGEKFSKENIRIIRPNYGIQPEHFSKIIGKEASIDIERGTPLEWSMIKE